MEDQHDAELREMLGRSVAQFVRLTPDERREILKDHLVQEELVVFDEVDNNGSLRPKVAEGMRLRREDFVGSDETGKQLVEEALNVYYGGNIFYVRLHWLCEFLTDYLGDMVTPIDVAPFVRRIIVEVDIHDDHHYYWNCGDENEDEVEDERPSEQLARWTLERLGDLHFFVKAEYIEVRLCGGGKSDGSDAATRQTIKDIAVFIGELIKRFNRFGRRVVDITKAVRGSKLPAQSILEYWNQPSEWAKKESTKGRVTFKETMAIEIAELRRESRK